MRHLLAVLAVLLILAVLAIAPGDEPPIREDIGTPSTYCSTC